jgi:hypothetical protein
MKEVVDAIDDTSRSHLCRMSSWTDDSNQAGHTGVLFCSLIEAVIVQAAWLKPSHHRLIYSQMLPAWRAALVTYASTHGQAMPKKTVMISGRYRRLSALPILDAINIVQANLEEALQTISHESDQLAHELQCMRQQAAAAAVQEDDGDAIDI